MRIYMSDVHFILKTTHTYARFEYPLKKIMLFVRILDFSRRDFCDLLGRNAEQLFFI
jgi:hypothetical protein